MLEAEVQEVSKQPVAKPVTQPLSILSESTKKKMTAHLFSYV